MINGMKKSDPIIDYPSLRTHSFEDINLWLEDMKKKEDSYAIKFYLRYVNKIILKLFHKIDDQNASIIRRGFKILEKWET